MEYRYREVKCPWCGHVFMWNEMGREGSVTFEYKHKETGKLVEEAKCPACEKNMLVLDGVFEGIDVNDDRIERIGIRGI